MTLLKAFIAILFCSIGTILTSQEATIALQSSTQSEYPGSCYDIAVTLTSQGGRLSAQNYRLYYDASVLKFDRRSAYSALTTPAYNPLKVVQAVHNSNASGYGNLEFSASIGYINMTITDDVNQKVRANIPKGQPLKTATFCFEKLTEEEGSVIWARSPLTKGYASAFTELSIVDGTGTQQVNIVDYTDIDQDNTQATERMATTIVD